MADTDQSKAEASAEKAYAAAAEAAGVPAASPQASDGLETPAPAVREPEILEAATSIEEATAPVEFPAKPKRAVERSAPKTAAKPEPAALPASIPAAKPKVDRPRALKPTAKTAAIPKLAVKRAAAKPAPAPKTVAQRKPAPKNIKRETIETAPKSAKASAPATPRPSFIAQLKEIPMDVSTTIKDAVDGAQAKAKEAFSKTSAAASEYTDFAKGNVEAIVESGKIIAVGLQEIGNQAVAETKTAFDTLVADAKALSSVKSPIDFFKLQTELLRRNIDHAVAYGSKTSESVIKLTSDAIAPISGRVTLAIEKVKKAA